MAQAVSEAGLDGAGGELGDDSSQEIGLVFGEAARLVQLLPLVGGEGLVVDDACGGDRRPPDALRVPAVACGALLQGGRVGVDEALPEVGWERACGHPLPHRHLS